jgi:hypothetical protein
VAEITDFSHTTDPAFLKNRKISINYYKDRLATVEVACREEFEDVYRYMPDLLKRAMFLGFLKPILLHSKVHHLPLQP